VELHWEAHLSKQAGALPVCEAGFAARLCATALSPAGKATSSSKATVAPSAAANFCNRRCTDDMECFRRVGCYGSLNGSGISAGISARNTLSVIEISA
jgi:hypothetical protein